MKSLFAVLALFFTAFITAQNDTRWQIAENNAIQWTIEGSSLPHSDNIEMAGRKVAGIIHYKVDSLGMLSVEREVIFPQLHPFIKETDPSWYVYRAYLRETFTDDVLPKFYINDKQFVPGKLKKVTIDGTITFEHEPSLSGVTLSRKFYPDTDDGLLMEELIFENNTESEILINVLPMLNASRYLSTEGKLNVGVASGMGLTKRL